MVNKNLSTILLLGIIFYIVYRIYLNNKSKLDTVYFNMNESFFKDLYTPINVLNTNIQKELNTVSNAVTNEVNTLITPITEENKSSIIEVTKLPSGANLITGNLYEVITQKANEVNSSIIEIEHTYYKLIK